MQITYNWIKLTFIFLAIIKSHSFASADNQIDDLFDISIKELTDIKITAVSKVSEGVFHSPAASYVITSDDIKRSGAVILPEILRFVPGVDVAQISANKWAVSARGFADQLSNKLLVLIDGRSVYTPHFSGVYWEIQDTLLEDIDRIEVIRGPGATLWGSNAVNGVINIITKKAKDTQDIFLSSGVGNVVHSITEGRHGGKIGDSVYYRTYAKFIKLDDLKETDAENANDSWFMKRVGFRIDVEKSPVESLTLQGDLYDGNANKGRILTYPTLTAPFSQKITDAEGGDIGGGSILGKWQKTFSRNSDVKLQFYYDNARRDYADQGILRQTFDVDFQHSWNVDERNSLVWGAGVRYNIERSDGSVYFDYKNDSKYYNIYNSFLQDKISLIPEELFLTIGSKFERNSFTGFEFQPSVKVAWNVTDDQVLWGSVSRAVRMPSRAENDIHLAVGTSAGPPSGYLKWYGNRYMDSEDLIAYELGYRARPLNNLSLDLAAFYNEYNNLRTAETGEVFPDSNTALSFPFSNEGYGESYGVELSANYDLMKNWRISANYTFFTLNLHLNPGSSDASLNSLEGNSPKNRLNIRSMYNIGNKLEFDNTIYYVDNLTTRNIPGYIRCDMRILWKPLKNLELSIAGQNLFDEYHPEFTGALFSSAAEVGRSIFGNVTWRY